jgi:hypothetical protein
VGFIPEIQILQPTNVIYHVNKIKDKATQSSKRCKRTSENSISIYDLKLNEIKIEFISTLIYK